MSSNEELGVRTGRTHILYDRNTCEEPTNNTSPDNRLNSQMEIRSQMTSTTTGQSGNLFIFPWRTNKNSNPKPDIVWHPPIHIFPFSFVTPGIPPRPFGWNKGSGKFGSESESRTLTAQNVCHSYVAVFVLLLKVVFHCPMWGKEETTVFVLFCFWDRLFFIIRWVMKRFPRVPNWN